MSLAVFGSLGDKLRTGGLIDRHAIDLDICRQCTENNGEISLTVYDSRLNMVIGTTQLVSQERAILEVVVGLNLAVLEVVRNQ